MAAETLNALAQGGAVLMMFVFLILLWRELVRSRKECEARIDKMQGIQTSNVSKIARLEGQIEILTRATIDFKSEKKLG